MHLSIGTRVKIKNYSPEFNGKIGYVSSRDGEYYAVRIRNYVILDLYLCELEKVKEEE